MAATKPTLATGLPLQEVLRRSAPRGGVPVQGGLRIAQQIADRLDEALQAQGGPLEPEPVALITPSMVSVGLDGVVRLRRGDPDTASRAEPGYAAPEILLEKTGDFRAGLFSLGVILFEMLAGRRLYEGGDDAVRASVLEEPPPDLGEEQEASPPELVELLFELLCKSPEGRPGSAAEVSRRLGDLLTERVAWEGALELSADVLALLTDEELLGAEPTTTPETGRGRATATGARASARRDAVVVTLLLILAALAGWTARIFFP